MLHKGVTAVNEYGKLRQGLAGGLRDFPETHQKVFFDYLKAVAAYDEFGTASPKMVKALEDAEANGLFRSVQTRLPWVTDVFLHGILAGAEARTAAMRELLMRFTESPDASSEVRRALGLDRAVLIRHNASNRLADEKSVLDTVRRVLNEAIVGSMELTESIDVRLSLARWCLKYLPSEERETQKDAVLASLGKVRNASGLPVKDANRIDVFCGKYETLPFVPGMEETYSALRSVSPGTAETHKGFAWNKNLSDEVDFAYQAELENALTRCAWRCKHGDAAELQRACEVVRNPTDARAVLQLNAISDGVKDRIANGIVGMEILWALAYHASRRLNVFGSGAIPGFHLGGRISRDGRAIENPSNALYNVDLALDTMVLEAMSRMLSAQDIGGTNIVTYAAFRDYREGEFDDTYLTAIVDNAIANRKHAIVRPKTAPVIETVSGDEVNGQDGADSGGLSIFDTIVATAKESPRDYAWFALNVVKEHTPKLWNYMRLVEWGLSASDIKRLRRTGLGELADKYSPLDKVSKGDALKIVGATTAHLVERERAALLKALESQRGADYEILAERLKNALKKV